MSIAPSFCTAVSRSVKHCFRRRAKFSGPQVYGTSSPSDISSYMAPNDPPEVVSPSRLSPEMEARVQSLPFMWRPKCHKVLEDQAPEMQLVQIVIFESLPDYTKTACSPPASTIITELVHAPKPVVEPVLNLDVCVNWFQDVEYDDEEEEEEEQFDDDATLRWVPAEWQQPGHEHVLPRMDLPHGPRQVAVHSVIIKNAPVVPEYKALPSPPSFATGLRCRQASPQSCPSEAAQWDLEGISTTRPSFTSLASDADQEDGEPTDILLGAVYIA